MWQDMASSQPPPRQKPLTAAMTTLRHASILSKTRWPASENLLPPSASRVFSSTMSAPATKAFSPAPVMTTAPHPGSFSAASTAALISVRTRLLRAFSFSGRLTVIQTTPFWFSTSRFSYIVQGPSAADQTVVRSRRFLRIVVEASSALLSKIARLHHTFQEGRRGEASFAELIEHDVGDGVGRVQTHEVEERERSHRMVAAQPH